MTHLVEYEIKLLRHLNGEDVPGLAWGAAMGEAIEHLRSGGYVTRQFTARGMEYVITEKGQAAITQGGEQ